MPAVRFCSLLQLWKPEITLDFSVQLLCQNWALDIWHELSTSCLVYYIRFPPHFTVKHTVAKHVKYILVITKELKEGHIQEKKIFFMVCLYSLRIIHHLQTKKTFYQLKTGKKICRLVEIEFGLMGVRSKESGQCGKSLEWIPARTPRICEANSEWCFALSLHGQSAGSLMGGSH